MLLFVDDDASLRRSIAAYARAQKRRVVLAANAEDAWATLMAHDDIDAIVCDLRMPGGGAIDLLRRARRINPGLRCTLLTITPDDLGSEDRTTLEVLRVDVVPKSALDGDTLAALIGTFGPFPDPAFQAFELPAAAAVSGPAELTTEPVFDVFLSYDHHDRPAVLAIADELRRDGLRVWLDQWELIPGRPWQEALEEMIERTKTAVVLVGASGIGPWERREMRACLYEFVSRNMPVIPVLLPGAPGTPALPMFLRELTWVDMRAGITRPNIERLEWGITGQRPAA